MPASNTFVPSDFPPGGNAFRRSRRAFLSLALASLLLAQIGCEDPPLSGLTGARTAVERARREGAPRYSPDEMKRAEETLRQAERSVTLQSARMPFGRDYREAVSLIERTRFLAIQAVRSSQLGRAEARSEAEKEIGSLGDSLDRAQEIKRYLAPRNPAISRLLVGAGVDLAVARRRLTRQEFPEAHASAKSGSQRVQEAEELLLASIVRYTSHPDLPSWRKWVDQAVKWSRSDREVTLVVDKLRRRMSVYRGGKRIKTYPVDLGLAGMERKLRAGDDATPEGLYRVEEVRSPGQTRYHRAFLLDYPNAQDRRRFEQARRSGRIPRGADAGGLIEIHGEGGRDQDWTKGCVALTNSEMDELASIVKVGTRVAIVGYNPREAEDLW